MALFSYRGTDPSGKTVEGRMEAQDVGAVATRLQELGLFPIGIIPAVEVEAVAVEETAVDMEDTRDAATEAVEEAEAATAVEEAAAADTMRGIRIRPQHKMHKREPAMITRVQKRRIMHSSSSTTRKKKKIT